MIDKYCQTLIYQELNQAIDELLESIAQLDQARDSIAHLHQGDIPSLQAVHKQCSLALFHIHRGTNFISLSNKSIRNWERKLQAKRINQANR